MKTLPRLLSLLFVPAALLSAAEPASAVVSPGPAHPTVLTVAYNKEMLSVVKVVGTDPVVMVGGQAKRIRTSPAYHPGRTSDFGSGLVQVSEASLDGLALRADLAPERPLDAVPPTFKGIAAMKAGEVTENPEQMRQFQDPEFGTTHFTAKLKSKERLEGAFALVVVYPASIDSLQVPTKYAGPNFIVHDLPVLPADQEVSVQISGTLPRAQEPRNCFIQIFDSGGHEVRTDHPELAAIYYRATDLLTVASAKEKYLQKFAGADHPLVPIMQPPPIYPDEYTKPAQPGTATLTVSSSGEVTKVEFTGIDDTRLQQSLSDSFGSWLFLPRLKSGVPIDTKVKIPLQF